MGGFCLISGCSPEIALIVRCMVDGCEVHYGPIVNRVLRELADNYESLSQDDLRVIGPVHPSGQPYALGIRDGETVDEDDHHDLLSSGGPRPCDLSPERDIRVVPCCEMGEMWEVGFVNGTTERADGDVWSYYVGFGSSLMVQTFALDIMVLATHGRMTPLRLWWLAMKQGFGSESHTCCLECIDYGGIKAQHTYDDPDAFPGLTEEDLEDLDEIKDGEVVKQRLVHDGKFWMWMAPDRFPVSPTDYDPPAPALPESHSSGSYGTLETLPIDIFVSIVSLIPHESLVNFASTSRLLRAGVFGNEYLARAWICASAPWWVPVPIRTTGVKGNLESTIPLPYPASDLDPYAASLIDSFSTVGLDWAYVRRCQQSGSMLNRRRIWKTALDIERVAVLAGV